MFIVCLRVYSQKISTGWTKIARIYPQYPHVFPSLVGLLTPRITLGIKFVFCRSAIKPKLLAMRTSAVIRVAEYHSCAVSAHIHDYLLLLTLGKSEDRKVSFITQPASKAKPIGHYLHWLKGAARFVTRHQVHQTLVTRHQMHQTQVTRHQVHQGKSSQVQMLWDLCTHFTFDLQITPKIYTPSATNISTLYWGQKLNIPGDPGRVPWHHNSGVCKRIDSLSRAISTAWKPMFSHLWRIFWIFYWTFRHICTTSHC